VEEKYTPTLQLFFCLTSIN